MPRWNPEKRLLEHVHTKFWQHKLQDTEEPNLMKEIFPYTDVPYIEFDHRYIPPNPAREIWITDTTFRDGQQARPPYTVQQIVDLYKLMHRLGGPNGVIRQSEFFLYTAKDREAVEKCLALGYRYPEVTGWIRAKAEDLKLVRDMGLKETGILTSCSDYHIFLKLKKNRRQALEDYLAIVKEALSLGIVPRCHFEDVTRADIFGFVVPFAIELMKLREESGLDIKIRLCDTLGLGVPFPEAALPRSVPKLVRTLIEEAGVPGELLEWHGHNDFYKVVINATAAWLYGCAAVNCALLGFGERTGNTPLEAMIFEYIALRGTHHGVDTTVITDIANYYREVLGEKIPPNQPFVGSEFNATRAGIHIDGLLKNEEIYNPFDTKKLLKRPIGIIITDKSGTAGIAYWINTHFHLKGDRRIDKRHPGVAKIYKHILKQYEAGRITSISNEEMMQLVRKYIPELFVSDLDRLKARAEKLLSRLAEELAERPEIRSLDPEKIVPILREFLEEHPYIQFIYVVNQEGHRITPLITHVEDRGRFEHLLKDEDYSDRPWFVEPFKTGRVYVSDFYTSKVTGALCLTVSAPIRDRYEEVVGVVGMDIRFKDLLKMEEEDEEENS
ncbi:histone-lysine N-methyltransferase [Thermosulfurimonas marina]|uniref:Histone-lysine N-methyltransferase n=1 Tax=Thermosulfurimonas marina TaxID=2047767 RepID=A0A6H1WT74_9BACT|nr:cache domain-containing protein [Thermosulfurimonas marina]QJA06403.1 histone-lysine N-methyltransferase [Thermosulfurimonas marina]